MARLAPLRAIRFDPSVVTLGRVVAPPYDVITDEQQDALYARDLRNIVRIDYGRRYSDDIAGERDRYTRARDHLEAWLRLRIMAQDPRPALYVSEHRFIAVGSGEQTRTGLFARIPARRWAEAEILPHERTLSGPKQDRLELMRATGTQTSAVFALWDSAPNLAPLLARAADRPPSAEGWAHGEVDSERHRLWVVDHPTAVAEILEALVPARLYVADGHHRYETAVAYAEAAGAVSPPGGPLENLPDAGFCLLYLCDAADPSIEMLPTHRLVLPATGLPTTLDDLGARVAGGLKLQRSRNLAAAVREALGRRPTEHAFAVALPEGAAVLHRPRRTEGSPRSRLDVVVLQEEVLEAACGLDEDAIRGGALGYSREPAAVGAAVRAGRAALGFCCNPCGSEELIAVSEAGEVMPQKSTYFYPKVPTGLLLSPI